MEKIKAFCVRYGALILIFIMCLMLRGCIDWYKADRTDAQNAQTDGAPAANEQAEGVCYTQVPGYIDSFDGALRAQLSLAEPADGDGARMVHVNIVRVANALSVAEFDAAPAMTFGGVRWDDDSYDLWIEELDAGAFCMKYEGGAWKKDAAMPRQGDEP